MNDFIKRLNKEFIILKPYKQEIRLKISAIIKYWLEDYQSHWILKIEHISVNKEENVIKIDSDNKELIDKTILLLDDLMTSYYGTTSGRKKVQTQISSEIL